MLKDWRRATKAYVKAQEKAERVFFFTPTSHPRNRNMLESIQKTALELDLFLDSPRGKVALKLLYVSEKTIVFGEYKTGSGYNNLYHEYFLNGTGLYLSVSGLPHKDSRPYQQITETRSITSEEAVSIYSKYITSDIKELIPWLHAELDKIAAAAPQPES